VESGKGVEDSADAGVVTEVLPQLEITEEPEIGLIHSLQLLQLQSLGLLFFLQCISLGLDLILA
jgi:hypothetical protein